MNVEQKLSLNKFVVDEGNPHIVVHEDKLDAATLKALTMVCPAGLYTSTKKARWPLKWPVVWNAAPVA